MKRILIIFTLLILSLPVNAQKEAAFNLLEKAEKLKKDKSPNPYIDRAGYKEFIEDTEKAFREKLAKE